MIARPALVMVTLMAGLLGESAPAAAQNADLQKCQTTGGEMLPRLIACNRFIESKGKKSNEDMANAYNRRGNIHKDREDYQRAISDYTDAIKFNGKNAIYYVNRSDTYAILRQYDRAIADADMAIRIDPKNDDGYYLRGVAYHFKDDCDRAIADYTTVIELNPKGVRAYLDRANCFESKGRTKAAIEDFSRIIAINPKHFRAHNNRGVALVDTGHYDDAIKDFTVALSISQKDPITYYNRAQAYRETFQYDNALPDYDASIALNPKYLPARQGRGVLLARMGRDEEAVAEMRQALALDPNDKVTQDLLDRIQAKLTNPKKASVAPSAPQLAPDTGPKVAPAPEPPSKAAATPASGEKRVALVIGNGGYKFTSQLTNPANDAGDVAAALRKLGFDVVEGRDLSRQAMTDTLRQFARKLDGAQMAVAFYAGHGLQVNGKNYLLPIDAKIEAAADLGFDTVELSRILELMETEKRVNLIFLDACRDNPLARSLVTANAGGRGIGAAKGAASTRSLDTDQGLAAVKGAAGTLIAYSTQPDNVALDGEGRNSPFAMALLKHIATPGLEIETMMKQVRLDVIAATRNKQVPWGHSSLVGDVYLNPK